MRPRPARPRRRGRRPGRDLGAEPVGVGGPAVRDGRRRRDPGQHQPGVPHARAAVRAGPGGDLAAGLGAGVQDQRLPRDGRRGARGVSGAAGRDLPRRPGVGRAAVRRRRPRGAGGPAGRALLRRPDQHPVHQRHDRLPQGRDAVAPQHPEQRVLRRAAVRLHRGGPDLHPGALLPLLRHGDGQPRGHLARRGHGDPGAGLRPGRDAARRRRGALHVALRRAHHVHRRARRARTSAPTTCPRCGPGSWPARRARSR